MSRASVAARAFMLALVRLGLALAITADDFRVDHLPDVTNADLLPPMHAGMIEIGSKMDHADASLFFWHFNATRPSNRTILWFNGGPGCSSMDGALLESGPLRISDDNGPAFSDKSWTDLGNLLFIDQPFGTGFSDPQNGAWVNSLELAAEAVALFLAEYAKIFPEILHTDIVLAGESFAGQYVPHIYQSLTKNAETKALLNIHGIALVNPWIDPAQQYLSYVPFIKEKHLVDSKLYPELDRLQERCLHTLEQSSYGFSVQQCELITDFMNSHYKSRGKCYNGYDVGLESPSPQCGMEWPPVLPQLKKWLNRDDVKEALHVHSTSASTGASTNAERADENWEECSSSVHRIMKHGQVSREILPHILGNVPMVLIIGENDYICNYIGLDKMVQAMEWGNAIGLSELPESTSYGSYVSERNLSVAHIAGASHMVPYDHLDQSLQVMRRWLGDEETATPVVDVPEIDNTNSTATAAPDTPSSNEQADHKKTVILLISVFVLSGLIFAVVWYFWGDKILQTNTKRTQYIPLETFHDDHDEADEFEV